MIGVSLHNGSVLFPGPNYEGLGAPLGDRVVIRSPGLFFDYCSGPFFCRTFSYDIRWWPMTNTQTWILFGVVFVIAMILLKCAGF
jgi:hypothetical protein